MAVGARTGAAAGLAVAAAGLAGCIAPGVEVIGALGITVDDQQRPVVVVEACDGEARAVELFLDREGLDDDEENEQVTAWVADEPVPGTSELAPHDPTGPWRGEAVDLDPDRGYVVTAAGTGDRDVLSQVAFRTADLAGLEAGTVYRNTDDPDSARLRGSSRAEFTAAVCDR